MRRQNEWLWVTTDSGYGLSSGRRQTITYTYADLLLMRPIGDFLWNRIDF